MKRLFLIPIYLFVCFISFTSCSENNIEIEPELPFDYIKFEIDGKEYFFTESVLDTNLFFDLSANETYIILRDSTKNLGANIFISSIDILNTEYPFQFEDRLAFFNTPVLSFQFKNFSAQDDSSFYGESYEEFPVVLKSFENNNLKGEFSGEIKTRTGLIQTIENGEFKVKLIVL